MTKRKKESKILAPLLKKIAPSIGASILLEPTWNIVGQITFKSGRKSYFRYNTLDLNPVGASDVAKDKDYAAFFMKKMGYPVPHSRPFYSAEWAEAIGSKDAPKAALSYATKLGFPLVVKPNSGSQGADVFFVHTRGECEKALRVVFKHDRVALIQKPVRGRDFRIVVLDHEVISAYERVPLSVTGNGKATIEKLLKHKQYEFDATHRDTKIKTNDPRILNKLKRQKLSLLSVLPKDQRVFLLDNANLSSGGDSLDVTESLHQGFKTIAINLTRDMGLRMCGVDIIVDGAIESAQQKYCILEINAAPGLDHYVTHGPKQQKIVEDLYLKVLKSLDS